MSRVVEAIHNLQIVLEKEYLRHGMEIHLEPNAFYRFQNELNHKKAEDSISLGELLSQYIVLTGPAGYIKIVRNDTLGECGLTQIYSEGEL